MKKILFAMSGVAADSIGFVEAHGTGTEMGDPIEVNALTQAFRAHTEAKGFCAPRNNHGLEPNSSTCRTHSLFCIHYPL
jgi:hypothetical protein